MRQTSLACDLASRDEVNADSTQPPSVTTAQSLNRIMVIGLDGSSEVGRYLCNAATARNMDVRFLCADRAHTSSRWLRSIARRWNGDYPLRAYTFHQAFARQLASEHPRWLVTTGTSPVLRETLLEARRFGVKSLNYSTDDPWNARHTSRWFLEALKEYDVVATPRAGTIPDFQLLGVRRVAHVPFGYCPEAHRPGDGVAEDVSAGDVFFAGGCDNDRLPFFRALVGAGLRPVLYGAYWERHPSMRRFHRGFASLAQMATLHAQTPVSVCMVRRANRDEHVMRTYEAAAMGACLAMEDTKAHRQLFGQDQKSVIYFSDPESLVTACRRLLAEPNLRQRLRVAARQVVVGGRNTYADRLDQMLAAVSER